MTFAEENADKVEFPLQPAVRSPSFVAAAQADKTPGEEGHELYVGAAVLCSFLPSSTVGTQAEPWGSQAARAAPWLRTASSHCKAPQPEPCSSPVTVQAGENTSDRPQIWVSHVKVKKGKSLVSLSAIPMEKSKPVQSSNWCTTKPGRISFSTQEGGREQSMNQTWFSCLPYEAEQAWPMAWAALLSMTPFLATDSE